MKGAFETWHTLGPWNGKLRSHLNHRGLRRLTKLLMEPRVREHEAEIRVRFE